MMAKELFRPCSKAIPANNKEGGLFWGVSIALCGVFFGSPVFGENSLSATGTNEVADSVDCFLPVFARGLKPVAEEGSSVKTTSRKELDGVAAAEAAPGADRTGGCPGWLPDG